MNSYSKAQTIQKGCRKNVKNYYRKSHNLKSSIPVNI